MRRSRTYPQSRSGRLPLRVSVSLPVTSIGFRLAYPRHTPQGGRVPDLEHAKTAVLNSLALHQTAAAFGGQSAAAGERER